ncbi:MAG: hypothetical protein ACOVOW_07140 [Spirosomataceae bacterium]|jgi:hypothetical protein|nr:PepSY-like domain-containing protein [Flectobacillus sp.]
MKNFFFLITGFFLLTLASCSQEEITPTTSSTSAARSGTSTKDTSKVTKTVVTQANLLSAISTYLTTNYAGYTFVNAYSETVSGVIKAYDVNITLNSVPYHLVFSSTGTFTSVNSFGKKANKTSQTITAVAQADLLPVITTYLTTNYAGYTFVNAYSKTKDSTLTGYTVNITYNSVSYHVTFDAAGAFVSVGTRKTKTAKTNVPVAQADLLATISTYLTANYAGYTFVNAYSEATSGVITNYDVNITLNAVTYHVVFDAAGTFVSVGIKTAKTTSSHVAVAQADLLATIKTYLTTKYSGYTFVSAYSKATSGVITNYVVTITSSSVSYQVVFDAAGTFVSVTTKKRK